MFSYCFALPLVGCAGCGLSLAELARILRQRGIKDIWCYTGRIYEVLCDLPETPELLKQIDVLVNEKKLLGAEV